MAIFGSTTRLIVARSSGPSGAVAAKIYPLERRVVLVKRAPGCVVISMGGQGKAE